MPKRRYPKWRHAVFQEFLPVVTRMSLIKTNSPSYSCKSFYSIISYNFYFRYFVILNSQLYYSYYAIIADEKHCLTVYSNLLKEKKPFNNHIKASIKDLLNFNNCPIWHIISKQYYIFNFWWKNHSQSLNTFYLLL